jgi:hypothetical protein
MGVRRHGEGARGRYRACDGRRRAGAAGGGPRAAKSAAACGGACSAQNGAGRVVRGWRWWRVSFATARGAERADARDGYKPSGAAGRPSDRGNAAAPPLVPPAMAPAAPPRLPRGPRSERAPTVGVEGCRLVWEVMGTRETRGHTRGAGGVGVRGEERGEMTRHHRFVFALIECAESTSTLRFVLLIAGVGFRRVNVGSIPRVG